MPKDLGDPTFHFHLTRSAARAMGFSLYESMQGGQLTPSRYADLVTRCRGCAQIDACLEWLSYQTGDSVTPPPGCCNAALLSELRDAN
jgi:hypothetical protein